MNITSEVHAVLVLSFIQDMGPSEIQALINFFGSAEKVLQIPPIEWVTVLGYSNDQANVWNQSFPRAQKQAEYELKVIAQNNIQVILRASEFYPPLLQHIACPPPFLYVKGELLSEYPPLIAIVGSRRCSHYGEKVAKYLTAGLTKAGMICVSGLARGIDRVVHESAIENGGHTWAVLGHGLSSVYPPENKSLAGKIEKSGALFSEFSMATKPFRSHFPRRNRIVAGVAWATLVIEGTEESGSLITARLAAQEGREVFAVPGLITSELTGAPHRLIQMGAKLVHTLDDILSELPSEMRNKVHATTSLLQERNVPEEFKNIWEILSDSPVSREFVIGKTRSDPAALMVSLTRMEMEGFIKKLPGDLIVRA